jgi:predicted ribosomally synthesized peptide with SipW-like signal peptide
MKMPIGGGMPEVVVAGPSINPLFPNLALNAFGVYWTTDVYHTVGGIPPMGYWLFALWKAPLSGGSPVTLATNQGSAAVGLTADATNVYWSTSDAQGVETVPSAGGTATTTIAGVMNAYGLTAAGGYIFWGNGAVYQAPIGGSSTALATISSIITGLAVDGTNVYWSDGSTVAKVAIGGGTAVTLTTAQNAAVAATDATYVYYIDGPTLKKVSVSGGTPIPLASCTAGGLAVDATYAYWTDTAAGTVNRVAK